MINGCYINLARSTDRRQAMEAQLQRLGLAGIRRFDAIDGRTLPTPERGGSRGERACFLSHMQAIASADPQQSLLMLEDDAVLSEALPAVLRSDALRQLDRYDIAFMECLPYTTTTNLLALWNSLNRHRPARNGDDAVAPRSPIGGIDILEGRHLYNWGAVAYLVTPRGLRTLPSLLREMLETGLATSIDIAFNQLVQAGRLSAAVLSPFLATADLASHARTTIEDRAQRPENDVLGGALRRLFFAGPIDGLTEFAAPWRHAPLTDDGELRLLADLMAQLFVLSVEGAAPPTRG